MPRVSREQARLNRERVVEVAATLFREHGLHGIGVADIMAAAGLTHGGFYGQFASKEALAGEAFDRALAEERLSNREDPVQVYLGEDHVRHPGRGCPIAALANDVAREPVGSAVRGRFTAGVKRMADFLEKHVTAHSAERRRRHALAALSTMVGAVILARSVDDATLGAEILEAARSITLTVD